MYVFGNFLAALAKVIDMLLTIYMWLIIIRALASWFSPDPYNPIYQFLYRVTEPVLRYIRRLLPVRAGMVDLSPFVAILIIIFLQAAVVQSLYQFALSLR
ncbi:MAG: YggT family protein [bacterium]|nr:MAG: YggT family protein [bacterium]